MSDSTFTSVQRSKAKYQIKQILAKTVANGCTEGEAQAASEKAERMMVKFGFTMADFTAAPAPQAQQPKAQAAKPKAEKKAKAAKATGGKRGPAPEFADHQVITVLVANPKRPGSAAFARFALYKSPMTVAQAIEAGIRRDDFRWDTDHGFITIE